MAGIVDYFDVKTDMEHKGMPYFPHIVDRVKAKHWRYHAKCVTNAQALEKLVGSVLEQGR